MSKDLNKHTSESQAISVSPLLLKISQLQTHSRKHICKSQSVSNNLTWDLFYNWLNSFSSLKPHHSKFQAFPQTLSDEESALPNLNKQYIQLYELFQIEEWS